MNFILRRSSTQDISSMINLIFDVHDHLKIKEWFVVDDPDITRKNLENETSWGYLALEAETKELAGLFIANFPGTADYNLGNDILSQPDLPESAQENFLRTIVHMDTAAVSPKYRGHHLQRRLMEYAEADLKSAGYTRLMGTVHPENQYSLGNALSLGYRIMATKEKYGGYLRHIMMKEI